MSHSDARFTAHNRDFMSSGANNKRTKLPPLELKLFVHTTVESGKGNCLSDQKQIEGTRAGV